jgi:hypothetical protein
VSAAGDPFDTVANSETPTTIDPADTPLADTTITPFAVVGVWN